jgi:hypothetical protein
MRISGYSGLLVGVMASIVFANSCVRTDSEPASTFDIIQQQIFTPTCAISGCHASTTEVTFAQHGLVLASGVAYSNLVNAVPQNATAVVDELLRVKPFEPDNSLLFHKLLSNADNHHERDYGNPMPLGLPLLTVGQVEFIKQWIEAGAPPTGVVADMHLLHDHTEQPELFVPLTPPAQGLQISIPEFTVAPNFEREFFVYKKLNNTDALYVNRIEIKMRKNSHHFLLYDFEPAIPVSYIPPFDVVRDIRKPDGTLDLPKMLPMAYHIFIAGAQTPYYDYALPSGVAYHFPADFAIDLNSHYVNKGAMPISGEVNINLHTVDASNVQHIARPLNLPNTSMILPPHQKITIAKTFVMTSPVSIITLTSHTHKLGEKFIIRIAGGPRDGEVVYTNLDWHHPPIVTYDPPIVLQPGEGLTSVITYNNTTTSTVRFGLTSDDEMGIIFGYYIEN